MTLTLQSLTVAAVGRPDETSDTGELKLIYRKRTIDPLSGALDLLTSVHFRDGKAAEVNY